MFTGSKNEQLSNYTFVKDSHETMSLCAYIAVDENLLPKDLVVKLPKIRLFKEVKMPVRNLCPM